MHLFFFQRLFVSSTDHRIRTSLTYVGVNAALSLFIDCIIHIGKVFITAEDPIRLLIQVEATDFSSSCSNLANVSLNTFPLSGLLLLAERHQQGVCLERRRKRRDNGNDTSAQAAVNFSLEN